jgi:nucleotide-binding universal stress UspA family protein
VGETALADSLKAAAGAFRDVLVAVLNTRDDEPALRVADEICTQSGGRAVTLLASPLPSSFYAGDAYGGVEVWTSILAELRKEAKVEAEKLRARIGKASAPMEFRTTELEYFLSREAVLMSARHADITIFTRLDVDDDRHFRRDLIETVMFQSGRPVLIAPPDWKRKIDFKNVVVAWNASRESARAVGDAAPILEAADSVTIVTVDQTPSTLGPGEAPGADIAAHLAHRGVKVEVRNVDGMGRSEADCLLDVARAVDADLIVLGAYGHSRMREFVFGGVTKSLLETSDRPLFMSH